MKYIYIYMLAAVATLPLYAQQDELKKQVEVTKEYAPEVEQAKKLSTVPRMIDTVALRPQGEYRISPLAWGSSFGVQAFTPIRLNAVMPKILSPFYLKVGAGFPLNSLLDFYAWSNGTRGSIGGYINHQGNYEKLTNDLDRKMSATESANSVGAVGERFIGSRMSIKGEVGYDYEYASRYGEFLLQDYPQTLPETLDPARLSYNTARASFELGNDFKDLSRFNFRVGASGYYFSDRHDNNETSGSIFAEIGKMFNVHKLTLRASFDGYFGGDSLHYYDRVITVSPRYEIELDRFKFRIGGDYVHDMQNGDNKSYFFPNFRMTFDVTTGYFVPFFEIDGELQTNGYRNTVAQNPYVMAGLTMQNNAVYNGRAGISGSFASSFSYKAYAGFSIYRGLNCFASLYTEQNTSEFVYINDKATLFTIGGDLSGRVSGSFMLSASAHYYGYTLKNIEKAGSMPNFDASLDARYNYRDKFSISAGATLIGRRFFYELVPAAIATSGVDELLLNKVSPVVDLHLSADFKVSETVGIFVQGENLLNTKLYPYNHYRGNGITATAGVKLTF